WSRAAGLVAATLSLAAPRLFFDAQLACFDAPIAAMWVAVVYAYWRALDERKWGWRTGVLFGLALATKHNAFFLPAVLAPHWLFVAWQRRRLPPLRPWIYMGTLGVAVYVACWPWLWFDTIRHFSGYVAFHVHHVYYNMEYLGRNYNKPPFPLSFPYVMEALTLPLTTMVLGLVGSVALVADWWHARGIAPSTSDVDTTAPVDTRATGLLVGINAIFPMAILTVTRAPIFGATSTSTRPSRSSRSSPATPCTPSPPRSATGRAGSCRRSPRSSACPRSPRPGARIRTRSRTTTSSPAARRAAPISG